MSGRGNQNAPHVHGIIITNRAADVTYWVVLMMRLNGSCYEAHMYDSHMSGRTMKGRAEIGQSFMCRVDPHHDDRIKPGSVHWTTPDAWKYLLCIMYARKLKDVGNAKLKERNAKPALAEYAAGLVWCRHVLLPKSGTGAEADSMAGRKDTSDPAAKATDAMQAEATELSGTLRSNCAEASLYIGDWCGAKRHADEAFRLLPGNMKALCRRGRALLKMGHLGSAERALRAVERSGPDGLKMAKAPLAELARLYKEEEKKMFGNMFGAPDKVAATAPAPAAGTAEAEAPAPASPAPEADAAAVATGG